MTASARKVPTKALNCHNVEYGACKQAYFDLSLSESIRMEEGILSSCTQQMIVCGREQSIWDRELKDERPQRLWLQEGTIETQQKR